MDRSYQGLVAERTRAKMPCVGRRTGRATGRGVVGVTGPTVLPWVLEPGFSERSVVGCNESERWKA